MDDLFCEQLRLRFSYDPDTGLIHSRLRFDKNGSPAVVGHVNQRGYMALCTMGKSVVSHRVAWLLTHGYWPSPKLDVDHINGNKSDNRLANLRLVSRVENSQNRHSVSRKKANKLIGAYFIGSRAKPWRAAIKVMGKLMNLGQFATEQEAHAVYLDAKRIYHPAFVRPNGG